ncbi:unnamed protein product, partial [Didymodactylos carnosus]
MLKLHCTFYVDQRHLNEACGLRFNVVNHQSTAYITSRRDRHILPAT